MINDSEVEFRAMVLKLWSLDQQPYYTWELVRNAGCLAPCRDTESETLEEGGSEISLSLFFILVVTVVLVTQSFLTLRSLEL